MSHAPRPAPGRVEKVKQAAHPVVFCERLDPLWRPNLAAIQIDRPEFQARELRRRCNGRAERAILSDTLDSHEADKAFTILNKYLTFHAHCKTPLGCGILGLLFMTPGS